MTTKNLKDFSVRDIVRSGKLYTVVRDWRGGVRRIRTYNERGVILTPEQRKGIVSRKEFLHD